MRPYPIRKEYLISYDVEENSVRTRLLKELQKYGLKAIQKSVFWGYLTRAELKGINRYMKENLSASDKAFIVLSKFNSSQLCYLVGHDKNEFRDWEETLVI